jgi:hypothetical protein
LYFFRTFIVMLNFWALTQVAVLIQTFRLLPWHVGFCLQYETVTSRGEPR